MTDTPLTPPIRSIVGLLFVATSLAGLLFPEVWWGTHFIAFVPKWFGITLLIAAGMLCILPAVPHVAYGRLDGLFRSGSGAALVVSVIFFALYLSATIATDIYGDARQHLQTLAMRPPGFQAAWVRDLLLPSAGVITGEQTVFALVSILSTITGAGPEWSFRILNAVSGAVFVFVWLRIVFAEVNDTATRIALALAGISAPFTAVFLGHTEIYAPAYAMTIVFWTVIIQLARHGGKRWALLGALTLYVLIELHISNVVFIPVYGLALWFGVAPTRLKGRIQNWRAIMLGVLAPLFVAGAAWYFATGRHVGTQVINASDPHTRWLLPMIPSPDAPPYHYMVFSQSHLFDTLNIWLLWAPAAWLILACALIHRRGRLSSDDPALLVGVTGFVLVAALFFVANPALTPLRDWDLWCFPATSLLVVTLLVVRRTPGGFGALIVGPVVGVALLALPGFWVQTDVNRLSDRLEAAAIWSFTSYWNGSTYTLNTAIKMKDSTPAQLLTRRLRVLNELEERLEHTSDPQFAHMVAMVGWEYVKLEDFRTAYEYFARALTINRTTGVAIEGMPLAAFNIKDYKTCLRYSLVVLERYGRRHDIDRKERQRFDQNRAQFLDLGFRSAVALGERELVQRLGRDLLEANPDATWVSEILEKLGPSPSE